MYGVETIFQKKERFHKNITEETAYKLNKKFFFSLDFHNIIFEAFKSGIFFRRLLSKIRLPGWVGCLVGGWMGGDQKGRLIFLIFK